MTEYLNPVDIANRALQHLGAARIDALSDDSKNAAAVNFAYDKVRRAELQRNRWRFAIKRTIMRAMETTTMILAPAAWSATTYYQAGNIVSYAGLLWSTNTPFNYANTPGSSDTWFPYFGPLTVSKYDSTDTYDAGELVWSYGGFPGLVDTYVSTINANDVALTVPAYDATVYYTRGDTVSYLGSNYISLIDVNYANTPASAYALWLVGSTYSTGNHVILPDGRVFTSAGNGNIGHDPATDTAGTYWTAASGLPYYQPWLLYTGSAYGLGWRYVNASPTSSVVIAPRVTYPLGSGPLENSGSRNIFMLPSGYLRLAPQDPKAGANSYLGAPGGLPLSDWELESQYLTSFDASNIPLRFIADITRVDDMDDMFCEGLAARIALELCEEITQSSSKKQAIYAEYSRFMTEARLVNGIEIGSEQPPEDDYIMTRL